MGFRRGLRGVLGLAPFQDQDVADFDALIHHTERKEAAFVPAVAVEHTHADHPIAVHDHIRRRRRVIRLREVEPLVGRPVLEPAGDHLQHVVFVEFERDLLPIWAVLHRCKRVFADEIVLLPADVKVVTQLERVDVIVRNVRADERAADGARSLIAVGPQPVTVFGQHAVAGVDARQGGRNPTGLERIGRIGPAADLPQVDACVTSGLKDCRLNIVLVGIGAPDFQTWRARHAVTQRLDAL